MKKVLFIIFLFFNILIFAQETDFSVDIDNYNISVSAVLVSYNENDVLDSLKNGFEAEIFFEFRLYEKNSGFLSFLGDKLLIEEMPYYIAEIDIFEKTYNVTDHNNETIAYKTEEEFVKNFFRITSYNLPAEVMSDDREFYCLARIHLNHVKLIPPLDLISLFYSTGIVTDWVEVQLNGKD